MKDSILFLNDNSIQVVSNTSVTNSSVYPFLRIMDGGGWEVSSLYSRSKRMSMGYITIEHFYTYNHISMVLCSVYKNHGFYLYILGNKVCLYLVKDNQVRKYLSFLKIRRLSMYKDKWFIQLEHYMTLFTFQINFNGKNLGVYSLGSIFMCIEPLFGEKEEFWYMRALGRYL